MLSTRLVSGPLFPGAVVGIPLGAGNGTAWASTLGQADRGWPGRQVRCAIQLRYPSADRPAAAASSACPPYFGTSTR